MKKGLLLVQLAGLGLALAAILGCGGGGSEISEIRGRIVKGGTPIKFSEGGPPGGNSLDVTLVPTFEGGTTPSGAAEEDGNFVIEAGPNFKPGKYKVAVVAYDPVLDKDILDGKFSVENTTIEREITAGDIGTIDLDKP